MSICCTLCVFVVLSCVFVVLYVYLLYLLCVFVVLYVYLLYLLCVFVVPYVYLLYSHVYLLYFMCICCTYYVYLLYSYVYLLYYVCIALLTLDAGLLARSQYPEGPATGHLDTGFSWFPSVYKRMLRWFPSFQVATTCFSCSPPGLSFLATFFFPYLCTCNVTTATG